MCQISYSIIALFGVTFYNIQVTVTQTLQHVLLSNMNFFIAEDASIDNLPNRTRNRSNSMDSWIMPYQEIRQEQNKSLGTRTDVNKKSGEISNVLNLVPLKRILFPEIKLYHMHILILEK